MPALDRLVPSPPKVCMPPVKALVRASILAALFAQPALAQSTFSNPASNPSGSGAPSTVNPAGPQANPNGQQQQHKHRHQHARSGDQNAQQAQGSGNSTGQGQQRKNWRQPQGDTQGGQPAPSTGASNN
jgi:hypothetical protein